MSLWIGTLGSQVTDTIPNPVLIATDFSSSIHVSDGVNDFSTIDIGSEYIISTQARPFASNGSYIVMLVTNANFPYAKGMLAGNSIDSLSFIPSPVDLDIQNEILYSNGRWLISGIDTSGVGSVWSSSDLLSWNKNSVSGSSSVGMVKLGNYIYAFFISGQTEQVAKINSTSDGGSSWTSSTSLGFIALDLNQYGGALYGSSSTDIVGPYFSNSFQFNSFLRTSSSTSVKINVGATFNYKFFSNSGLWIAYDYNGYASASTSTQVRDFTFLDISNSYPFSITSGYHGSYGITQLDPGGISWIIADNKYAYKTIDGSNWTQFKLIPAEDTANMIIYETGFI
jgi:hypothetical protein